MSAPALSVQLYSVRQPLEDDASGTLARLAEIGFRHVEAFDFVRRAAELSAALSAHGLTAPTGHAPLASSTLSHGGEPVAVPTHAEVLDAAAELGIRTVIDPMVPVERWASADEIRRTAENLNNAAAAARERGLTVGYHNHSQEFHHSFDGVSGYELFVSELEPDVLLELDAYWAQVGKQDVPALVTRLGERLIALHVKDGKTGTDPFLVEDFAAVDLGQVPAGQADVPLDAILDAATSLQYAVVEFDRYDGDIFEGIAGSVAYLAGRGIR